MRLPNDEDDQSGVAAFYDFHIIPEVISLAHY